VPESLRSRVTRWGFNLFPAYRGTGARIAYVSSDWREVRVRLPLSWRTRNYVGTIFGGSLYGSVDPIYMIMLIKNLGPAYTVWDKAATIRFQKPGRGTLHARFRLEEKELVEIRRILETEPSTDRVYVVELADAAGTVHATVEKTIYIRKSGSGLKSSDLRRN
jgi:acyl-coenzyme A thioesterase PaaI-like protein